MRQKLQAADRELQSAKQLNMELESSVASLTKQMDALKEGATKGSERRPSQVGSSAGFEPLPSSRC